MVEVHVRRGESIDRALRRFKKKFEKAGIMKDYKKNTYYVKPSAERKMKKANAIKRLRRRNMFSKRR